MTASTAARLALLAAAAALRHAAAVRNTFGAETSLAASTTGGTTGGDDDDDNAIFLTYDADSEDEDEDSEQVGTDLFPKYKEGDIVNVALRNGEEMAVRLPSADHGAARPHASSSDETQPAGDQERKRLGRRMAWCANWHKGDTAWAPLPKGAEDRFINLFNGAKWAPVEVMEDPAEGSDDVIVDFGMTGFRWVTMSIFHLLSQDELRTVEAYLAERGVFRDSPQFGWLSTDQHVRKSAAQWKLQQPHRARARDNWAQGQVGMGPA